MQTVTEADLKSEIADMRERFPHLQDSKIFVAFRYGEREGGD
jgi:hypothetical protein